MIRNRELVSRAKVVARDRGADDRERILLLIDQYEAACDLSLGLDPSRSAVWERKAAERRNSLRSIIGDDS